MVGMGGVKYIYLDGGLGGHTPPLPL